MRTLALGVEEAACTILERLGDHFSDAEVDYESFAGLHSFIVKHAGIRFRLKFSEQTLLRTSVEQLEETIRRVTETVLRAPASRSLQPQN